MTSNIVWTLPKSCFSDITLFFCKLYCDIMMLETCFHLHRRSNLHLVHRNESLLCL